MEIFYIVYIVCFLIQISVFTFIWSGFYKYVAPANKLQKSVSIIVAVKNESSNIEGLVESICTQNYPDYQVIIVDDHSLDNSLDLLHKKEVKYPNLKVLKANYSVKESCKKAALTQGIETSTSDFLLFTDADCIPATKNWVQSMVDHTRHKNIVLGISPYKKENGTLNDIIQFETTITYFLFVSAALWRIPYMGIGRNLLIKKELIVANDYYNQHIDVIGGDDDLTINKIATKENTSVNISPEGVVYSLPVRSYGDRIKQKVRHFSVSKYYSNSSKLLLGIVNSSWIMINILFVIGIISNSTLVFIIILHILRTLLLFVIFGYLTKKSRIYSVGNKSIYLDIIYSIELLILGPLGLLSKKIIWQQKKSFQRKPYKTSS